MWTVGRRPRAQLGLAASLVATAALLVGCGKSSSSQAALKPTTTAGPPVVAGADKLFAPAPPPDQVVQLASSAGLKTETAERLAHHVHSHLDVFVDGQPKLVPAGIGIVITDPAVHHAVIDGFDQYGGISVPCDNPCISPLHTHDTTGVLHTESATNTNNTLGQFFTEWGVKLDGQCVGTFCNPATPVAIYVNGRQIDMAQAGNVPLGDGTEIAVVIGKPPAQIPNSFNPG